MNNKESGSVQDVEMKTSSKKDQFQSNVVVSRRDQAGLEKKQIQFNLSGAKQQTANEKSRSDSRKRRLEKNRLSARESRKRKKTYIEVLEFKLEAVQAENLRLRG